MEITVKTLDSQTKTLQVAQDITVQDFKAKIADEMKIPVEKQRLIFQGKVLQDDKPLQEYKVNGCVVHLVERQPPRTTRSNGQSTETTTSVTPTTNTPGGNMFMGAFAVPVDVMGVTQQIIQGIVQQVGADSAQANISTTSSDDGSSVNVHINLSTVMTRNEARLRIAPARVHLNNVSRIIHSLQNGGLPSERDVNDETSGSQRPPPSNGGNENHNNENALENLADVLQQVVQLNDEIRPHLERYQELLRSNTQRELRPVDDLLPDLTAEALHSLSHAYHALSDVTTNFRAPEPRLNVLPSMSPVPATHGYMRNASNQSQSSTSSTAQTATAGSNTGQPPLIPVGIGFRPGGGGLGTGIGLRTGRGVGLNLRPGFTLRPGNSAGASLGGRGSLPTGVGSVPNGVGSNTSQAVAMPAVSTAASTASDNNSRPQETQPNPLSGLPINIHNLPNFAVQFNPASGNITIAHIVTTVVEEPSLRTTTTTTNSTPAPRTSSRGSNTVPENQPNPTSQSGTPMMQDATPASQSESAMPQNTNSTPQSNIPTPRNTNSTTSQNDTPIPQRQRDTSAVVNFMPQTSPHRDPLLPCQSFHFASLSPRTSRELNQTLGGGQTIPAGVQRNHGQTRDGASSETVRPGDTAANPEVLDLAHLLNVSQERATAAAASQAAAASGNGAERNPFLDLFAPSQAQDMSSARDPTEELMLHMAATIEENRMSMTPEELAEDRASVEQRGTLSRYLHRLVETIPVGHLFMTVANAGGDPYLLTRSMTRDFLRDDILRGAEATPENLQRATERILTELKETFESAFAQCNVKDNIDGPATLLTYLRPKIRRLLEAINSAEPDSVYLAEISALVSRTSAELVTLTEHCLEDGRAGMQNVLMRALNNSTTMATLDPALRPIAVNTMLSCIEDLRNEVNVRPNALLPFVVRKEKKRKKSKPDSDSPKMERKEQKKEESSRSSDISRPKPNATGSQRASSASPSSSRRARSSPQSKEIPMDTDETWKKVIPPEWVPVISQDILRQQRMPRQAPFSDAYLNGMPAKRRKLQKTNEPAPYDQCVSATLKRSIAKAGVTPKTDPKKLNEEANSSQSLSRNFEDEVKSEVRKRLAKDTDYNSEKFPSIHEYFEKDEKR